MKRLYSIIITAGLGLVLAATSLPASAALKESKIIEDPLGDANFVNDQGTGDGSNGDQTAADAGTVSDIIEIALSNDAKNLYVRIGTEAAPPAATAIGFRVRTNPDGAGGAYCILIEAMYPGANNVLTAPEAYVRDTCGDNTPVAVEVLGTTLVIPRSTLDAFGKGATLTAPQAQSYLYSGSSYPAGVQGPYADTTLVGADYKFKK